MIRFKAACHLSASGKQRRFSIIAYTGGELRVDGFPLPVVVDLTGLQASGSIPILVDHQADIESTLGVTDAIENSGRALQLRGSITGRSPRVLQALEMHDNGHRWQASVGLLVQSREEIPAGRSVSVNGQSFTGPIIVARRSTLRETSVLPMGADSSTSVNLAASAALSMRAGIMSFEEWVTSIGLDPATLSDEARAALMLAYEAEQTPAEESSTVPTEAGGKLDLKASRSAAAAEYRRVAEITAKAGNFPRICAAAIEQGWTAEKTELEVLKASRQAGPTIMTHAPVSEADRPKILEAALCMQLGVGSKVLKASFGEQVLNRATEREHRDRGLFPIFEQTILRAGQQPCDRRMSDGLYRQARDCSVMLRASGFTTVSLPGVLSNVANKTLLQSFEDVPSTWRKFCTVGSAPDFKTLSSYRVTMLGALEQLGAAGEIKHIKGWEEQTFTNKVATRAKMLQLTRESIINDDLGVFSKAAMMLGRMAAIALEKNAWTTLLSGITSGFFHTDNGNYFDGSPGSLLSVAGLTTANEKFLKFVDANGDPAMMVPRNLIVGATLATTGQKVLSDVYAQMDSNDVPDTNPFAKKYELIVSPFVDSQSLTNATSTGWFLSADPVSGIAPVEMLFLNGQQSPTVESEDADFDQLGMQMRCYFDFGSALQEPKSIVHAKGAA